jgi:pyrroloquinoline quinone biosynthesis protein B
MGRFTAIVLGSAAGGGFPQWNCLCPVCRLAWQGDPRVKLRTQTSLAVSNDGEQWTLLNASPDLREQIRANAVLQPRGATRASPISAVVLTGAEADQIAGLLHLREGQPFTIHGTAQTLDVVAANPVFGVLGAGLVVRRPVELDDAFQLPGGIEARLFAVPGKPPLYLEGENPATSAETAGNVGVELRAGGKRLMFVPGCADVSPSLRQRLSGADVVLFDATLYTDDEMVRSGTGVKTGRRMGHIPLDGPGGTLDALAGLAGRRILIHINNTNSILIEDSAERRRVAAAGFVVAEDGMEITL